MSRDKTPKPKSPKLLASSDDHRSTGERRCGCSVCRRAPVSLTSRIVLTTLGRSPVTHWSLRLAARRDYGHLGFGRRGPMHIWSLTWRPARPRMGRLPRLPDPPRETFALRLAVRHHAASGARVRRHREISSDRTPPFVSRAPTSPPMSCAGC
jgi:hypothetical protein